MTLQLVDLRRIGETTVAVVLLVDGAPAEFIVGEVSSGDLRGIELGGDLWKVLGSRVRAAALIADAVRVVFAGEKTVLPCELPQD